MRSEKLSKPLNDFSDLFWVVIRHITGFKSSFLLKAPQNCKDNF